MMGVGATKSKRGMTTLPGSGTPRPSRARAAWNALVGAIATVFGLLPHVFHHIGLLAGVAFVTGAGGTILFGVIGLAASIPLLLRLQHRFHTWRAPAIALAVFALMFSLSSFVIGPALSEGGNSAGDRANTPASHDQHHQP